MSEVIYDSILGKIREGDTGGGGGGGGGGETYIFDADDFQVISEGPEPPAGVTYIPNRLFGKVLCCCGDSITAGTSIGDDGITDTSDITVMQRGWTLQWAQRTTQFAKTYAWQIAHRNHMTLWCDGLASTAISTTRGEDYAFSTGRYNTLPNQIDYLTILFGANDDWNGQGVVGTINDTTNATYYGAWNVVLPYLINKYPTTKIGIIIPYHVSAEYRQAARLVADKWGIPYFDMFQAGTPLFYDKEASVGLEASIATARQATYLSDGIHPNLAGHTFLADMLENWLKSI